MDVLADTVLLNEAVRAAERFVREYGTDRGVKRTQVTGLRQIAANEPGRVGEFAKSQLERAQKRNASESEQRFWLVVSELCDGKDRWSLEGCIEQLISARPKLPKVSGKITLEQQRERADLKRQIDQQQVEWDREAKRLRVKLYASFFQHFCLHYIYLETQPRETP
jgi:hypothetical protein